MPEAFFQKEHGVIDEHRLREAPHIADDLPDWNTLGARIVEAAEQASVLHLRQAGGRLIGEDIANLLKRVPTDG